jgi:Calpain family cysteine protease
MYNNYGVNTTVFAGPSKDRNSIWAAIFEKAWAKMKGNYLITESGYI